MDIAITLPINDVNAILQVLGKLPYEQVVRIIDSIREQVAAQTQAPPDGPAVG